MWDRDLRSEAWDLRTEAVLAELILASAIPSDGFLQWPNGGFGRTAARDIQRLHPAGALEWAAATPVVEVNRSGLYDLLPEGLFHEMRRSRPFIGADAAVEEVRRNNAIAEAARTFFVPLDNELLRLRLHVELNERRLTSELLLDHTGKGVTGFWDAPQEFSARELGKLLMLLPVCHRITGDTDAMAHMFSEVLAVPVRIGHTYARYEPIMRPASPAVENSHLGVDTVLGDAPEIHERILLITLGPLVPAVADTFAPGQPGRKKLSILMEYFAAADQVWDMDIHLKSAPQGARLAGEGASCRLGVSTILN